MYVFDPAKHSDKAKDGGAGAAEEGRAGDASSDGEAAALAAGSGADTKQAPSTSTTQPSEIDGAPAAARNADGTDKKGASELPDSQGAVPARKPVGELPGSDGAAELGAQREEPVEMGGGSTGAAAPEGNDGREGAGRGAELHF